ncbi:MAG: alpha/beta hydrolase [Desulfomonile tiedjei]|nr:alpha/beta hydrolase [Desulfomonile tiedjei]
MGDPSSSVIHGTPVDQRTDGPGVTRIDSADPAASMYDLLAKVRSPVTLRDMMIFPVRAVYAGQMPPGGLEAIPHWDHMFPNVTVEEMYVPSPDGPVRCQVYRPDATAQNRPMMLYVHGGGFMLGRSEDTDYITRRICAENGVIVVSVNYRLAPEWPFPAGLDDCLAVYCWMREHGPDIGGDPGRVGVAGDSSGGNFAAVLPLLARSQNLAPPDVSVMFAPVLDFLFEEYESFNRMAPTGVVYDAPFMGFARGAYCRYSEWTHPHVSPLRGDLGGFPNAMIIVGTHDPIVDSCLEFARKLRTSASNQVELFVREGMPHGFYFWPDLFPQEEEAYGALAVFLRRHLGGATQSGI